MPTEGVDYSFDKPSPQGLANVGKVFACRYVGPGSSGKLLTQAEAHALADAGLWIVANAEGGAGGLAGGAEVGRAWAISAHNHALQCGMPPGRPIYLSVDFDMGAAQWPAVREALQAAGDVLGPARVGVYGGYDVIELASRDRVARWLWQTFAWSEGRWHPLAHIRQYRNGVSLVGGTVDLDHAMAIDYGQWVPGESPADGGDTDVNLDQESIDAIANAVVNESLGKSGPTVGVALQSTYQTLHGGDVSDQLTRIEEATGTPEATPAPDHADQLARIEEMVRTLADAPSIDPVALATALTGDPAFVAQLGDAVSTRLGRVVGEINLSGSADLGVRPPSE